MAFTWTSNDAVKGEFMSADSINEVRNLLNTMYNQVNCSTRNAVVYNSDNSSYDSSKDSSIVACTTVYSSRNSSYCTVVNASQTITSYLGDTTGCTENNVSQYSSNSCDSYNASQWSADNYQNDATDNSGNKSSNDSGNNYSDYSGNCNKQQYACTGDNSSDYSMHHYNNNPCTSNRYYNQASNNGGNQTTDNGSNYSSNRSGNCSWDNSSDCSGDHTSDYDGHGKDVCVSQNSSRYGSKAFCPSYNNAKYVSKNSSNRNPYNASVRVCYTVYSNNG